MQLRGPITLLVVLSAMAMASLADALEPSPEIVAPATRDVTPPWITPGPSGSGPLIRGASAPAPADPPRWRRFHLPKTTDAATFRVDNRTIKLAGVSAPNPDAACRQTSGTQWPCGRTALYSFRMFLRGRAIECFFPHIDTAVEITAPCRVGATDLALWLLSQGWVMPDKLATKEYRRASSAARCAGRGLWRGGDRDISCGSSEQN